MIRPKRGFSESGYGCKKHPNHEEKQGVCPSCLRERLSRLCSVANSTIKDANSKVVPSSSASQPFSPADNYSSAFSSHSASPTATVAAAARRLNFHKINGSGVMGITGSSSFSTVNVGANNVLKKSRSMAFVPRIFDDREEAKVGKKKKGFWSKLLGFKGKKDGMTHSTSMRLIIGRVN